MKPKNIVTVYDKGTLVAKQNFSSFIEAMWFVELAQKAKLTTVVYASTYLAYKELLDE